MSAVESPGSNGLEIAIVGMAGRFPGAETWRSSGATCATGSSR